MRVYMEDLPRRGSDIFALKAGFICQLLLKYHQSLHNASMRIESCTAVMYVSHDAESSHDVKY